MENNLTENTAQDFVDNDMIPENIVIPVHYVQNNNGKVVYDIDEMHDQFMCLLDVLRNKSGVHYVDDDTYEDEEAGSLDIVMRNGG